MSWMLFPENPALSALVLGLIAVVFLYAARTPVHGMLTAVSRIAAGSLRVGGQWLSRACRAKPSNVRATRSAPR